MPYSFTKIERDKTRIIAILFLFLVLFYFLSAWTMYLAFRPIAALQPEDEYGRIIDPEKYKEITNRSDWREVLSIVVLAIIIAATHWTIATRQIARRILGSLKAKPSYKSKEPKHQLFENILEELSAATGGEKFEGFVLETLAINAFSLIDLEGRQVIGVTEGLLARCTRAQIEAVVAHEAAHILKGDSLVTTLVTSMFNVPSKIMDDFTYSGDYTDKDVIRVLSVTGMLLCFWYPVRLILIKTVGQFLNMLISRQREYRADAIAVRLTRNPLSLAEALYIASHHWHGAGVRGENMEAIFILNPRCSKLDESEGLFSDLFSTHPPVDNRISILLDMAHTDLETMKESLGFDFVKFKKVLDKKLEGKTNKWLARKGGEWFGPYEKADIEALDWVKPYTFVKKMGDIHITTAGHDPELKDIIGALIVKEGKKRILCPHCYVLLREEQYEGHKVLKCHMCEGVLVDHNDATKIVHKKDAVFSDAVKELADLVKHKSAIRKGTSDFTVFGRDYLTCPNCYNYGKKMTRRFYSMDYHVEIDQCSNCGMIWFDKDELETLQYLS